MENNTSKSKTKSKVGFSQMSFIKRHLLMIVICVMILAVLLSCGKYTVNRKIGVEQKQSSYKLTNFEYVITSPSKEQVKEFSANSAVNTIFPCYNFEIKANGSFRFPLLMCDSLEGYEASLFNEETCISGGKDENGIMLDETAAKRLGVKVGDDVSFSMSGHKVTLKVSGIYMASTYRNFEKGLGLAVFTDEMKSYFANEITYKLAFIDAADTAKCEQMLDGYVPLGDCMTEETYIANRKKNETCPDGMTVEAWEAGIKEDYLAYKEKFENGNYPYAVQAKEIFMEDIQDQIATRESDISYISVIAAISVFAAYTALGILYIYKNKGDDQVRCRNGASRNRMLKDYLTVIVLGAVAISLVTGIFLSIFASANNHFAACVPTILMLAIPVLPAALIVSVFAKMHIDRMYQVNMHKKSRKTAELLEPEDNEEEGFNLDGDEEFFGEPEETEKAESKPEGKKSAESKPEGKKSAESKPEDKRNAESKSEGKRSAESKPEGKKSAESKPEDKRSAESKPEGKRSAESKPEGKRSTESKPEDKRSAESKPEDKRSAESKPEGKKSAESKPEGKRSAESKPEDKRSAESKPEEKRSAESKPEGKKSAESKPEDKRSAESKPEGKKSAESKPEDKRSAESKPEGKRSTETKIEENISGISEFEENESDDFESAGNTNSMFDEIEDAVKVTTEEGTSDGD